MIKPLIKSATASDKNAAVRTVVLAFSADPVARWFYPDAREYLEHFPSFVRAFAAKAVEHDSAYYVEGYSGAALWLPPDIHPEEDALIGLVQRTIPDSRQPDVFALLEKMNSYHPSEPHWYLPMIGVEPAQQNRGYGSALMKHALSRCDRDNKLAYLESSNSQNISLYRRHGFELIGTIQVETSPPLYPMLRRPARSAISKGDPSFVKAGSIGALV